MIWFLISIDSVLWLNLWLTMNKLLVIVWRTICMMLSWFKIVLTLNKNVANNYDKETSDISVKGIAISGNIMWEFFPARRAARGTFPRVYEAIERYIFILRIRPDTQTMPAFLVFGGSAAKKYSYFFPYNINYHFTHRDRRRVSAKTSLAINARLFPINILKIGHSVTG